MAVIKQWTGTEWVVMTTGYTGSQGYAGSTGAGYTGSAGTSNVYDVAVANGYVGSEGGFYADLAALSELSTALAEL
jgi:hypothetical protein